VINIAGRWSTGTLKGNMSEFAIQRSESLQRDGRWQGRMRIRTFKHAEDMHRFLGRQTDNKWSISSHDLPAGLYAFAGGKWHNVKTLDPSVLAHV